MTYSRHSRPSPRAEGTPAEEAHQNASSAASAYGLLLSETLAQVNREVSPGDWSRAILPAIVRALGMDTGAILWVVGDSRASVLIAYGPTRKRGYPYRSLDLHDPALTTVSQRSAIAYLERETRGDAPSTLKYLCHMRFGVIVLASAFMGNSLQGLLVFSRRSRDRLSEDQAALLAGVCDAVGLALGTASLHRETSMSEVILETACTVARSISGSLDLDQTFRQIADSAARMMGESNCLLLELADDGRDLVAVACSDPDDDALLGLRVRFEDATSGSEALSRRRSIVVEDVAWGAGTGREYRERLDMRSALFVPIQSEGGLIGSLLLYSTARRGMYSESDIARAETIAEQAASAICNARLFSDLERSEARATALLQRITRLRERQRLSFANILHDDIVQTMVAALYRVEGLRASAVQESREDLDGVAGMLKQSIADARGVIWELRPPVLEGLGLEGAFRALVKRIAEDAGMEIDMDLQQTPEVQPDVATALYVVAREALQNARKHAHARRCTVSLSMGHTPADEQCLQLTVGDNGVGFDMSAVAPADHFGLTLMDEQITLVGGVLSVDSVPGTGTSVCASVPLAGTE